MSTEEMNPVKENRSYVKGNGGCVNVDNTAFATRKRRLKAQQAKDDRVVNLENQISELTNLVKQLISKG